ncbi:hypothetical protein C8T65DRAFT_529859, partial [Cerioporus squamosus]
DITKFTAISRSTIYRAWRAFRLTGRVSRPPPVNRQRRRLTVYQDVQLLLQHARHNPTLFLDEYCSILEGKRLLSVSLSTVHRVFARAGLSHMRLQKLASERSPFKRADYIRRIGQHPPASLYFLDEVSKDERTYGRLWGRAR